MKTVLIIWAGLSMAATFAADIDLAKLPPPATRPIDFAKDVQPIFAESCYGCHGPKRQEVGLRFDVKEDALKGSENGPVIIPGKSAESRVIHAVSHLGDLKMPKKGERLSAEQVGVLGAWIDQGAQWPETVAKNDGRDHWAYKAPTRPSLPKVKGTWAQSPIDKFILARLEKEALKPSPEADKTTLLRRLSLDLIGLPPTPEEIDSFINDKSKDAFQKQVERLLKSPHYGEKWGRQWLDAARYADSDGFEKDKSRSVWFYRDWVVKAFNADVPYDQFVISQLAGDQLPKRSQDDVVATGFLRNSMLNEEGAIDPEQFRMEAMFDRMDAVGKSVLGLTIQCAQCHTHKYDPIQHEDYYRMFAALNNAHEANIAVYSAADRAKRDAVLSAVRKIESEFKNKSPDWKEGFDGWLEVASADATNCDWSTLKCSVDDISTGGQRYLPLGDGSLLCQGYAPTKHTVVLSAKSEMESIAAIRLDVMTDANLPLGGPGRSTVGSGALTEFEIEAAPANDPDKRKRVKIDSPSADFNAPERPLEGMFDDKSNKKRIVGPIAFALDGREETAWTTDAGPGRRGIPRTAVFRFAKPIANKGGSILTVKLKQ